MRAVITGGFPAPSFAAEPRNSPLRASRRAGLILLLSSLLVGLVACNANDPEYIEAPMTMEAGLSDPAGMGLTQAKASLQLPIKTETAADKAKRDALAAKLAPILVPYVKVGDLELDVEWTIKNLDTKQPGQARIQLNGA